MSKFQLIPQTIYCGDNKEVLKDIPDESVDLIYIDPPFNSNRNYEVFWGDAGEKRAFNDRYGDAKAYIDYMRPRMLELHRVLKKTGSFYYHCDWHASHYVKVMLDEIFGFNNFQNEIIWYYKRWTAGSHAFQRMHDTIFFYSKTSKYTFNKQMQPFSEKTTIAKYQRKVEEGRSVQDKEHLMERDPEAGVSMHDVWEIPYLHPMSKERMGYPTQKPVALLERIINASSNSGDMVLDAFCGCGTALAASQKLGRKWVGIDISPTACRVMSDRLYRDFRMEDGKDFRVVDDSHKSEEQLMNLPPFEFQNWAVIALGGIPNAVKVGDFGIDGKLYPIENASKVKSKEKTLFGDSDTWYPIQVKQKDKAGRPDIDSFETAIRRDKRSKGYFVSFDFTSDAMAEIRRLDREGEIEIRPVRVRELLEANKV